MKSRKVNIIISLIAATLLWVYVVGEMDPVVTKTYHDVPIQYTNEQALESYGLDVESYETTSISVTLTGKRSDINRVTKDDIAVTVDLSEAQKGTNKLTIHVTPPRSTEVTRQSANNASVKVGNFITESKPIRISYMGDYGSDTEPTTLSLSQETVNVSGAEGQVDRVAYVRGEVEKSDIGKTKKSVRTSLTAVDKDGNVVKHVRLSTSTVKVESILYSTKSVKLNLTVQNAQEEGLERTYSAPDTIKIKGTKAELDKVTEIEADAINLAGVRADSTIPIVPHLPDGVQVANGFEKLTLKVSVSANDAHVKYSYDKDDIDITNQQDGFAYVINNADLSVTVTGTKEELAAIKKGDVRLSISVTDLQIGTHEVPVTIASDKKAESMNVDPQAVSVTVTKKSDE